MSLYYKFNVGVQTFYPAKIKVHGDTAYSTQLIVFTNNLTLNFNVPNIFDNSLNIIDTTYVKINGNTYGLTSLAYSSDGYKYIGTYDSTSPKSLIVSADGGSVGPFRWIIFGTYIDEYSGGYPICAFNYGASITLNDGESLNLTFKDSNRLYTVNHV